MRKKVEGKVPGTLPVSGESERADEGHLSKFIEEVRRNLDPNRYQNVIVAYSGGADSTFLALIVSRIRETEGFNLLLAHLDHSIRPESRSERPLLRAFVRRIGAKLLIRTRNVPALAKRNRLGLEESGRKARYEFFAELLQRYPESILLTAHNLDDNAESVVMNLARGTGLRGLIGIRPSLESEKLAGKILRPLLPFSRREIREMLRKMGSDYIKDPTNELQDYRRNYVRKAIIPKLRKLNPKALENILHLSRSAERDIEFIDQLAARELKKDATMPTIGSLLPPFDHTGVILINQKRLGRYQPALIVRILINIFERITGSPLSFSHLEHLLEAVRRKRPSRFELTRGIAVEVTGDLVILEYFRSAEFDYPIKIIWRPCMPENGAILSRSPVISEGNVVISEGFGRENRKSFVLGSFSLSLGHQKRVSLKKAKRLSNRAVCHIDVEKIVGSLRLRSWRPGDRIEQIGLGARKKLSDLFQEKGIPLLLRRRIPILCDRKGPIWIPCLALSERVALAGKPKLVLEIRIDLHKPASL